MQGYEICFALCECLSSVDDQLIGFEQRSKKTTFQPGPLRNKYLRFSSPKIILTNN